MINPVLMSLVGLLILLVCILVYQSLSLKKVLRRVVAEELNDTPSIDELVTREDIVKLPEPVQRYLAYTGMLDKPKVSNARIITEGQGISIEQYYFFRKNLRRLSFIRLRFKGVPVYGLDSYIDGRGSMIGKVLGLLTVIKGKGPEIDQSEAAVLLCDMCSIPAALIDRSIQWETIDPLTVRATLTDNGLKVSGELRFNGKGELTEFSTNDKLYQAKDGSFKRVGWTQTSGDYKEINGLKLATFNQAIWHHPQGDEIYGKLHVKEVTLNLRKVE